MQEWPSKVGDDSIPTSGKLDPRWEGGVESDSMQVSGNHGDEGYELCMLTVSGV